MRGLKKFVMGEKDWSYEFPTTRAILQQDEYADINQEDVEWLHTDNRHRTFACSEPESFGERPRKPYRFDPEEPKDLRLDKYLHGVGLVQERWTRMQYTAYTICPSRSSWFGANAMS